MNITEVLMNSSLRGLIPDSEIEEIAEEIAEDIETLLENETEKVKEDLQTDIDDLHDEIKDLKREIETLEIEKCTILDGSLRRVLLMEWIEENISDLDEICFKQLKLKDLLSLKSSHARIILAGRAASGKDHMRNALEKKGFKYGISYTTRPPRNGEIDGKDYFFLSVEKFEEMISQNLFYEYVSFNGWYYGTTKEQFYRDDIFIMTPHGISHLDPKDRANSVILFFDIPYEVRRERLMQRCDADTVDRRLEADDRDFSNFSDYDVKITDPNF
jgi:guanylate kinase